MGFAIGEAQNPGPHSLAIGAVNTNGLLGKAHLFANLRPAPTTLWAISETHATVPGKQKLAHEFKSHNTGYNQSMGSPVEPTSKSVSAVGGKQNGVGFLTTTPVRHMQMPPMPPEVDPARVHCAAFHCRGRTIQGGVVYGIAFHSHTHATRDRTDLLCQQLTTRLLDNSHGLRFIGGDFNQPDQALPSMQHWVERGWVNVQQWAWETHGIEPKPTCKGKTIPDHLFLSPELAMYLRAVCVEDDWFTDHSVLYALFDDIGNPPLIPMWRTPHALPWEEIGDLQDQPTLEARNHEHTMHQDKPILQTRYQQVWQECERRLEVKMMATQHKLSSSCKGRASTFEVRWVREYAAPVKPSRHGEFQPSHLVPNLQYTQWIRQLRRLVNWARLMHRQPLSLNQFDHATHLWESIIKAPGFTGPFVTWWNRENQLGPPLQGPVTPHAEAVAITQAFQNHVTAWERSLKASRLNKAKQRRQDDPNVIFRDLQAPKPQPLQMLVDKFRAKVEEVDELDQAVVVSPPQAWQDDQPLYIAGKHHVPLVRTEDKLWLSTLEGVEVGQMVSQDVYIDALPDLFRRFNSEWATRWERHRDSDDSQWQAILAFADDALPAVPPMPYLEITLEQWRQAVQAKPTRAATGPDGVSKADLERLPDDLSLQLIAIFHEVEQGHPWPIQLLEGFVIALEKLPDAHLVQHFRPIVVFPVAYRVWHSVMNQIEEALHDQIPLSGGVLDIVKAYNMLPRKPVQHILNKLGVAKPIMTAWTSALTRLRRRFRLRSGTGPPVMSHTGYPEGCALSCCAMLAMNVLCHAWARVRTPAVELWSYVDNWEIVGTNPSDVLDGMQKMEEFCDLVDLPIDKHKTYLWSLDAQGRQTMKPWYQIQRAARDLGGHMQYSKQVTNFTVQQKLSQMPSLWNRLARSTAHYRTKLRAVRTKAWPSCLHAIASTHLGEDHYIKLRTGCTEALGLQAPGFSAITQLSLIEDPRTDPQCCALLTTVLQFRQYHNNPQRMDFVMQHLHSTAVQKNYGPGPCSVLPARLHQVEWSWQGYGVFNDHFDEPCQILTCPVQEITRRLMEAWQLKVQRQVSSRITMEGVDAASPLLTLETHASMPPEDQALLARCLNGTYWAADHLKHVDAQAHAQHGDACRFCGQQDSQTHRHWDCTFFADVRPFTQHELTEARKMPLSFTAHGWIPAPPELAVFRRACLGIEDETTHFALPPHLPRQLHIFSDGSCKNPTSRIARLASWAIILADTSSPDHWPVASGLVPGWCQTSLRAEILAAISACQLAILTQRSVVLWTDNDLVHKRVGLILDSKFRLHPNQKDADLWGRLAAAVNSLGSARIQVVKVVSHQDPAAATDPVEKWAFLANQAVDALAETTFAHYPDVMQKWHALQEAIEQSRSIRSKTHQMYIAIGKKAVQQPKPQGLPHTPRPSSPRQTVEPLQLPIMTVRSVPQKYQCDSLKTVLQWLQQFQGDGTCRLISWYQLNFWFEFQTGSRGVEYDQKTKQWYTAAKTTAADFPRRSSQLSAYIQGMWVSHSLPRSTFHARSSSCVLTFWTRCVPVRVPEQTWLAMEQSWLKRAMHLPSDADAKKFYAMLSKNGTEEVSAHSFAVEMRQLLSALDSCDQLSLPQLRASDAGRGGARVMLHAGIWHVAV
eukprot:Skav214540  [mRNA]  locus=scaffold410:589070:596873:+ [translate_table: standard]